MKKLSIVLLISFMATVITFSSCKKDADTPAETPSVTPTAEFQIKLDGAVFTSAKDIDIGLIKDANGKWINELTIISGDVITTVNEFPRSVGEVTMSANGNPGLVLTKGTTVYNTTSGKLKRESSTKITFSGTCVRLSDSKTFTISGFVKSDDLKVVVE